MVNNNVTELVERIDRLRIRRGMSVMGMCERAGIRPNTYYCWLEGIRMPNLGTVLSVLNVLGVNVILEDNK